MANKYDDDDDDRVDIRLRQQSVLPPVGQYVPTASADPCLPPCTTPWGFRQVLVRLSQRVRLIDKATKEELRSQQGGYIFYAGRSIAGVSCRRRWPRLLLLP